ncbi:MAG: hypothetical protein NTU53_01350 [Planctomycetota bacterium]|nr:hypothetical protein [Planctomycetota bacterium]
MKQAVEFEEMEEVEDVPVSAILKVQKQNRYGSVPDLDDEELADPDELERQVMAEEWWPVLMIPTKKRGSEDKKVEEELVEQARDADSHCMRKPLPIGLPTRVIEWH